MLNRLLFICRNPTFLELFSYDLHSLLVFPCSFAFIAAICWVLIVHCSLLSVLLLLMLGLIGLNWSLLEWETVRSCFFLSCNVRFITQVFQVWLLLSLLLLLLIILLRPKFFQGIIEGVKWEFLISNFGIVMLALELLLLSFRCKWSQVYFEVV